MPTSRALRSSRSRGFTLVEILVAAGLSGIVLAGVLAASLTLARNGTRLASYSEMEVQIQRALEQFGAEARRASNLTWNAAGDLTLTVTDQSGATSAVTYAWTAASQAFFRVPGTSSSATAGRTVLVGNIPAPAGGGTGVVFERLTAAGAATTADASTKFLRVSFALSRRTSTVATATQRATALFALRNKATP